MTLSSIARPPFTSREREEGIKQGLMHLEMLMRWLSGWTLQNIRSHDASS